MSKNKHIMTYHQKNNNVFKCFINYKILQRCMTSFLFIGKGHVDGSNNTANLQMR